MDLSLDNSLSESEQQNLMTRLYYLLADQTEKYLAGDSTSVPVETAEELLRSLFYTIQLALSEVGKSERDLLTDDLSVLLEQGRHILQDKLTATRKLWERVCLTIPQVSNTYLDDTLKGLKTFFKHYDLWYFAHQIPCTIDYPLCVPVSDNLQGVSYVEQWLRHLLIENWFLSKFPSEAVIRLLSVIATDFWDYPLNLCEQPLLNAVGLAILQRPLFSLEMSSEDCRKLSGLLFECKDMSAELNRGSIHVATELGVPKEAADYLKTVINSIMPRLEAARKSGDISGIFISSIYY